MHQVVDDCNGRRRWVWEGKQDVIGGKKSTGSPDTTLHCFRKKFTRRSLSILYEHTNTGSYMHKILTLKVCQLRKDKECVKEIL